ncbi:MAG: ABC transporter substrate-binding protein [Verrucomicrobiota bacterium]
MMSSTPQRIVCLSAEAADWLWRLGAWDAVVGVTAYFEPPPSAASKPRVSGFSSASLTPILQFSPDLVVTFSDVQAGIAGALVNHGVPVLATNQRTLAEVEATLALLARVVGCETVGERLRGEFREKLSPVVVAARPRVYFEEWDNPLITGIAWVSELIERAGGMDVFAKLRHQRAAPSRVISPEQVRVANPEIILASWCGKPVNKTVFQSRPGWMEISAVRNDRIYEIPSADILQPGFRLIQGYEAMKQFIKAFTPQPAA